MTEKPQNEATKPLRKRDLTELIVEGDPKRHILDIAGEKKIDLIALGRQGGTALEHFFIGRNIKHCGSRGPRRADYPNSSLPGGEGAGSGPTGAILDAIIDAIIEGR